MPFDLPSVGLREVDWSNPLTRGLKAFYILDQAGYVHNLADRRNHGRWANIAAMGIVPTREGLATYFSDNATSQRLDLGSVPSTHPLSLYGMPRFTVATRATLDGYTGTNSHPRLFDKSDGGNAANGWAIYDSNTSTFRLQVNATDVFQFNETDFPLGVPNSLVYVSRNTTTTISGANMSAYVNGQEVTATSTGSNTFPSTTTNAAIGNWNHSTDREWLGSVEYFALWDRDLTDAEVKAIDADIYQMFRPPHPLFKAAAAGGDITVNATTQALTLTAHPATVSLDVTVDAATETLTLTGHPADIALDVTVNAGTQALTLTPHAANVSLAVVINATTQALTLTAHPATVTLTGDVVVNASVVALTLTAHPATVVIAGVFGAPSAARSVGVGGESRSASASGISNRVAASGGRTRVAR